MPSYKRINQSNNSNPINNNYRSFNDMQNVEKFNRVNSNYHQYSQSRQEPRPEPRPEPRQESRPEPRPEIEQFRQESRQIPQPKIEQFRHLQNKNLPSEANEIQEQVKQQQQEREEQINNIQKDSNELENINDNNYNETYTDKLKTELESELRQKITEELEVELRQKISEEYKNDIESKFQNEVELMKNNLKDSFEEHNREKEQERIDLHRNITINDITEKYENADNVDGYHLLEVNRLLQSTPSLSFEQARQLANINGCEESGSNSICPSKKVEFYQEKGNCVGNKCKVSFSDSESDNTIVSQIKKLDIEFYSNERCGFCHRSKELFEKEGILEYMTIKENSPLPEGVEGFPHFVSKNTGKGHTGAPSSVESLVNRLS